MTVSRRLTGRSSAVLLLAASAFAVTACSTAPTQVASKKRSKEYFSESAYGVKASPRVSNLKSNLPRGGGRDQIGKPYKVKGQWFYPKEDKDYKKVGAASWYGDAFHGRLTANGEVYDMTHLTAAHPTMPLPSYARVTNVDNGSSVVVRVNDRGPFERGRIIDLSRRAAELLDYQHHGVAKVEVEYLGRAPLHGQDEQFLVASYRPNGGAGPDPSDGLPTGVMIAMNGATPTAPVAASAVPFPGQARAPVPAPATPAGNEITLPAFGPIAPERPDAVLASSGREASMALSYADERVGGASQALSAFAGGRMSADDVANSWRRLNPQAAAGTSSVSPEYIAVGTYPSLAEAEAMARSLSAAGSARIEGNGADAYTLSLFGDGRLSTDDMLRQAWAAGAADAMTIRD
ncbi:septal ring lytic transglycosylase RlpA family protein [Aquamicrobium sp. LC103]|uniref:septal ring lytic transglycosylase RlpA family protein n=1 Tax=Aquamicrobium sp. LC103 TaxID=1120658 RepID=UPI00063E80F2|nr:septal ring lytic transglycosylase RlpA family protein [Aquamicrobium sp. LC103]TKT79344.1 septal ring lytic transglycosylase RlpA family protein [Aquamicrobium sp. LC103]